MNAAVALGALTCLVLLVFAIREWQLWRIPLPQPGQVWRSENSGLSIRIGEVRTLDDGTLCWTYYLRAEGGPGMCEYGAREWRLMVREGRRVLVGLGHVPPRPLPPPAPPRGEL